MGIELKPLLNADECAKYFGVTTKHFRDKLSKSPDFPRPVKLPSGKSRKRLRWKYDEIMQCVKKCQEG